jgi:hypothetical protein
MFKKILVFIKPKLIHYMVYELAIIIFGAIFRIREYLFNRSLWLDESAISLEIVNKSLINLFKPLGLGQSAPIGFLILEKIAVAVFGISEQALRFFPLILGLGSIWLFYIICKKILDQKSTLIALFIFCFSEALINYSTEVKPYIFDVFISLTLFLMFSSIAKKKSLKIKDLIFFAFYGSIALYFSQPAIFILAGIGVALLLQFISQKKNIYQLIIVYFFWGLNFVLNYFLFQSANIKNSGLQSYWSGSFAPFPPLTSRDLGWYQDAVLSFFNTPFGGFKPGLMAVIMFVFGCIYLIRKNRYVALGLLLPLLLTLVASAFQLYPFTGRLLLFLIPSTILTMSLTWGKIMENKNKYLTVIGLIVTLYLFVPIFLNTTYRLFTPRTVEEIRPLIKYLQDKRQNNDRIYLYYGAQAQFEYYLKQFRLENSNVILGTGRTEDPNRYQEDIGRFKGQNRVWFIFSHIATINGINEEKYFVKILDRIGKIKDSRFADGASLYLYDLSN